MKMNTDGYPVDSLSIGYGRPALSRRVESRTGLMKGRFTRRQEILMLMSLSTLITCLIWNWFGWI